MYTYIDTRMQIRRKTHRYMHSIKHNHKHRHGHKKRKVKYRPPTFEVECHARVCLIDIVEYVLIRIPT